MPTTESRISQASRSQPSATIDASMRQSMRARRRQESRVRVDRPARVEEVERRVGLRELNVGLVERVDRADVGPVAAIEERVHAHRAERAGMISLPKSMPGRCSDVEHHVAREDVDPHRRDERLVRRQPADALGGRCSSSRRAVGASASPRSLRSAPSSSKRKIPISVRRPGDRLGGDRDVGAALDVRVDQLAEVHAVEMIAGKDQIVLGVVAAKCRAAWRTASAVP